MSNELKFKIERSLSGLVNSITGNDGTSDGQELYDRSPLATTGEILETERKAKPRYMMALKWVAEQLHPLFTFDDVGFEVRRPGFGTQQYISTHKKSVLEKGFVGVFRGDYGAYDDTISKIPLEEFSDKNIAKAFVNFALNNLRLSIPNSNSVNGTAKGRELDPSYIGGIVSETIVRAKIENKESSETIEKAERFITSPINYEELSKDSLIFKVIPCRKIKQIGPFRRNLVAYNMSITDASTGKKLKPKQNSIDLARELIPDKVPESEREAIASVLSHYYAQNPNGKYIVLADPNIKGALELGDLLSKETGKSVPVELIVSQKPKHYNNVPVVETKEKSSAMKYAKYTVGAVAGLGLLYFAAKGIKSSIPVTHNYSVKVNGENISGDSVTVNKSGDLEFLVDGKVVAKKQLKAKQEAKPKPKKKEGGFK